MAMLPFATEFPVKKLENRVAFIAEICVWLKGSLYSKVLADSSEKDLDEENAHLRSDTGEELRFRELRRTGLSAVGFRHDFPDDDGRLWRTEGVLRRTAAEDEQDLIRFRTQCLAKRAGAHLENPKKPYLIKSLIKSGWGGKDATLVVSDQPVWLEDSGEGLATARAVTFGQATKWLPTVYVSATRDREWLLPTQMIEKLAYDLGGVAHVVVEPSRAFSFRLRDESAGSNAYGGTLALAVPMSGIVRRYYVGWQFPDVHRLVGAVRDAVISLRGQMPAEGWDWTELQEQALRAQREREKINVTDKDFIKILEEEIGILEDRVKQLKQENQELAGISRNQLEQTDIYQIIIDQIGPEIYEGEILDRLRYAARMTMSFSDQIGLDSRSRAIFQRITDKQLESAALNELKTDIARATKDAGRVAGELPFLLSRHGYRKKASNKHIRLEAGEEYVGLDSITVPTTPSDYRGLKNLQKQINRTLGLSKL